MAKNTIADLDPTSANNTDVLGQSTAGSAAANTLDTIVQNTLALLARFYGDVGGTGTVGGSANAVTLTTGSTYQAYEAGLIVALKAGAENTAAATLNVDGIGAKPIRLQGDVALSGGEMVAGGKYSFIYDTAYNSAAGAWVLVNPSGIPRMADPNADRVVFWDDSAGAYAYLSLAPGLVISGTELRALEAWGGAVSDETTAIATGTGKLSFSIPYQFKVVGVYATLNTVSSSGTPTFDINEAGVSILSTKIVIDANEYTGGSSGYQGTAAAAAVISDDTIAAFAQITVDIDVAGTGAKGAKVFLVGYRNS